ncbi:MAG: hypothetical protein AABY15_06940 [Nanoarchaeota archaeon]
MAKRFHNGFHSWRDTFFEMVQAITIEWVKPNPKGLVKEYHDEQGHAGLYDLAEMLADKFEKQFKGEKWEEKDYWEEIEAFVKKELFP